MLCRVKKIVICYVGFCFVMLWNISLCIKFDVKNVVIIVIDCVYSGGLEIIDVDIVDGGLFVYGCIEKVEVG